MTSARRWAPYTFVALAFFISAWRIIAATAMSLWHVGAGAHLKIVLWYNYTILLENYFTDGLIRRGVGGSLFYLLRGFGIESRLILFHLLCGAWLLVPLAIVLRRLARTQGRAWIWLSLVLVLSPQLFLAWAKDVAKADMLAAGFVVWAMLACLNRRYLLAAVLIFLGAQVHELAVIYGGPLCVAIGFLDYRSGQSRAIHGVAALGLLGGLLGLMIAGQQLVGPAPQELARHMLAQSANPRLSEFPVYMTVGGFRTLASSACMAWARPYYHLYFVSVFAVFPLYGLVLPAFPRARLGLFVFVGLAPLVFLSITTIDYGRWLSLAVLNWWLMNAALQLKGVDAPAIDWPPPRVSIAAALVVLAMGPGEFNNANLATSKIASRLWPDIPISILMDRCDPTWRSVLHPPSPNPPTGPLSAVGGRPAPEPR